MVTQASQVYTYHYNGTGSTIAMTDQNRNIINKYSYTAFGLLTNQDESIPQPFKYAGRYGIMSEPGGLYYMRARYYDPQVGRFISEDPSGFDGGINLYAYANNNPINFVDPLGLEARGVNWRTVGIGAATATLGITTIVGGLMAGTAATVATGGAGLSPGIIAAGAGVTTGMIFFGVGMGDIATGVAGGNATVDDFIREYYSPDLSTAVNPF